MNQNNYNLRLEDMPQSALSGVAEIYPTVAGNGFISSYYSSSTYLKDTSSTQIMPKVGDKIRVKCYNCSTPYDTEVSFINECTTYPIYTSIECPRCRTTWLYDTSYIIKNYGQTNTILSDKRPMKKLSIIAKQLLDKDLGVLVKAGILNNELEVEDKDFVLAFMVTQYKKEMADEARKLLKEKKDDKKSKDE